MLENNKHIVSPEELDHLLNQAFLELDFNNPKNDTIMETISNQVMSTDLYVAPQKTASYSGWLKNILAKYKIGLSVFALIILSLITYFFIQRQNAPVVQQTENTVKEESFSDSRNSESIVIPKNEIGRVIIHKGKVPDPNTRYVASAALSKDTSSQPIQAEVLAQNELQYESTVKLPKEDSAFVFPTLTEKEIKNNKKQKKKMIEKLAKLSKDKYARIPMGSFSYNGETVSLQSFYMQTAEVTNLEYRTFLYDLLIEGKKKEFTEAKPNQTLWLEAFGNKPDLKPMQDNYFSHAAYNEYPVVNVSRKGVQMYCDWLTSLTNDYLKENKKPVMNDLRIPTDFEWTYAAQAGLARDYPWGTGFVTAPRGCYYMNFNIRKESIDTIKFVECNKSANYQAISSGGLMLGKGTLTVMVYAYNPNDFMLYCMSGNVAEMVNVAKHVTPTNYTFGTKGGSWYSDREHVKVNSIDDEYKNAINGSPFVGFRPVFTTSKK